MPNQTISPCSLFSTEPVMLALTLATAIFSPYAKAANPAANSTAQATKYSTQPFDLQGDVLSGGAENGHNAAAIFAALRKAPIKDQYETSVAFEERFAAWKAKPLVGNVTAESTVAVSTLWTPYFSKLYDADSAEMTFLFDSDYDDADGYPFVPFRTERKKLSPGHGQTAMGVKFSWTREYELSMGTRLGGLSGKSMTFSIQPEEARTVVPVLLFVGKIDPITTYEAKAHHAPTLSERWENAYWTAGWTLDVDQVWVIDGVRRSVLAKLCKGPHRFERCQAAQ